MLRNLLGKKKNKLVEDKDFEREILGHSPNFRFESILSISSVPEIIIPIKIILHCERSNSLGVSSFAIISKQEVI